MNNKGFAITGILYTILIMFILILLSVLSGLNSRMQLMEKAVSTVNDDYILKNPPKTDVYDSVVGAKYTGKYVFTKGGETCSIYLSRGQLISSSSVFIGNNCSNVFNDIGSYTIKAYVFGEE